MNDGAPPVSSPMLVVLCTCPPDQANRIAKVLVEQRVAACVNVTPSVQSIYRWQNELQKEEEALLLIKTSEAVWPALEKTLQQLHPYEVPEIIALPVAGAATSYQRWVEENLCTD